MSQPNLDRRRFFGAAAGSLAAAQLFLAGAARAQSAKSATAVKPGTHTSFPVLKQINAGVLNVGYAEAGPAEADWQTEDDETLLGLIGPHGHRDLAYTLLFQDTAPSWLYEVAMGATTIWERWDGQKPDSTFQTPGMNSFNHYAYGAIGDWMYRQMAGLDTEEDGVGYKKIKIQPQIGGGFEHAAVMCQTPYGNLGSDGRY